MKSIGHIFSGTYIIVLLLSACQNSKPDKQNLQTDSVNNQSIVVAQNNVDTLITTPCAIFIEPTTAQIDSMKKIGEENFYVAADDYVFYMSSAGDFLDSMKIKQIYRKSIGTIGFQTSSGKLYKFNLNTFTWGLLLFNGKTAPLNADVTMVEEEYKPYMEK